MGLLKLLRDMAIGADVIRHQSDLIRSQDETIAMHAEEIHLLEVELAASKNAEALIDKESDLYAAEIRALDQAVVFLYDLAVDKLQPADDVRYDTIRRSLQRTTDKDGKRDASIQMIGAAMQAKA